MTVLSISCIVTAPQDDSEQRIRWQTGLEQRLANPETPVAIQAFLGPPMPTSTRPVRALGADGRKYVLKGAQAGRQVINDQVIGRLGMLLSAAVPESTIAEVDPILTGDPDAPEFSYFQAGLVHASLFVPGCIDDRSMIRYQMQAVNRDRFARLSVLYGWAGAADRQFLYTSQHPNRVYSVDHGNFFPNGPNWTISSLQNTLPARLDSEIVQNCQLSRSEIQEALIALRMVSEPQILEVVARPPAAWGITIKERVALVAYLVQRRQALLDNELGSISQEGQR